MISDVKWINSEKLINKNLLSDRETLLYLKNNPNIGIVRYGNSELGLIVGNSPRTQKFNKELRNKLITACQKFNFSIKKKYILALPIESLSATKNNFKRSIPSWYPGTASRLAMRFLIKEDVQYGSPHCFRIINILDHDIDGYIKLVESLFNQRKIIYVGPLQGKNSEIPQFMNPSEILKIPEKDAFEKFNEIFEKIKKLCEKYENPLVVIVGGITATALSYQLNMSNITCYDFGQFNRLYKKYKDILK